MSRRRFYVPLDEHAHPLPLGSDPEQLAVSELGIEFWAEPGSEVRAFKVYPYGEPLDEAAAVIGSAQTSHGLVWYLVELAPPSYPRRSRRHRPGIASP